MNLNNVDSGAGLSSLFDFGFTRFITLGVVKVLYALGTIAVVIFGIVAIVRGFAGGAWSGLLTVLIAPLFCLLYLVVLRVWLEFVVVVFRIGENTSKLVELHGGGQATGTAGGTP